MCGIAGMITRGPLDADTLASLRRSLAHRGPDQNGISVHSCGEWNIGLVHTRLSILDLSAAGRQPMQFRGSWITYNGEVYNYRELRSRLRSDSGPCESATDTEVVLRAYAERGTDAFADLRGMFALAIWDESRRRLVLARDPLGIKPLYFFRSGSALLFASELRALIGTGLVPRRLNQMGLASYLRTGSVEEPHTIVEGIRSLPAGHCGVAELSDGEPALHVSRYCEAPGPDGAASAPPSRSAAIPELLDVLTESVRLHLVSDVPLGIFLSGGLDSSALVALSTAALGGPPRTYSVCFDEPGFSEESYAATVARRFGTEHQEIRLTEGRMLELLPGALRAMDQPTADGVNTYVISGAVKQAGITVALSGLGGDELFAGYPSFRRAATLRWLARVPRRLRACAAAAGRTALNGSVSRSKFWDLVGSDGTPQSAYAISRRLFSAREVAELAGAGADGPPSGAASGDPVNAVSELELRGYMANTLLRDSDFMSMAHALEVRVPFVDPVVVQYVLSLPGAWKLDRRVSKPLLVEALHSRLPEVVWRRRKMGFTLPFERWLTSALREEVGSTLRDGGLRWLGLNAGNAAAIWARFLDRPHAVRWTRPWALFVVQRWCELNGVRA